MERGLRGEAIEEQPNGTRPSRRAFNEATLLEGDEHPMDGRWRDLEVALEVGLGGRLAVDLGVVVDECEVLALLRRVSGTTWNCSETDGGGVVRVAFRWTPPR